MFVVAIFRSSETGDLGTITAALFGVGLAVLLLGAFLTWRAAQRVIAPVDAVTQTAHQISETDLSRRIPVTGDDEVAQLARTFNEMLDRLESAFATQRRFLDDAGHELRTPITIVRGHLEVMGDEPRERAETLALVLDELDRMSRLVDDVLTLAKAERHRLPRLRAGRRRGALARGPRQGGRAGAARLEPGRDRPGRDRRRSAAPDPGAGAARPERRPAHRARATRSCSRRRSPPAARASRCATAGPASPPGEQEHIFERFRRGPDARRDGAGLGLAIVRAIAEAHGGGVEVSSHPPAGAVFTIDIPVDPPAAGPSGGGPE